MSELQTKVGNILFYFPSIALFLFYFGVHFILRLHSDHNSFLLDEDSSPRDSSRAVWEEVWTDGTPGKQNVFYHYFCIEGPNISQHA